MTLTNEQLFQLKEQLLKEKGQLEEQLGRIAQPIDMEGDYETKFTDMGTDEDENASEVEEYADNLAVENDLEKSLKDVLEALERIDNGTYGKCVDCQEEIPFERLLAYPAAKTCVKCTK